MWIASAFLLFLACNHDQDRSRVQTVRVALNADGITWQPVRLAQSRFAARENIAIAISEIAGGSKGMEALLGGSVDVCAGMLPTALQAAAQGRDVRSFLVLNSRPEMGLLVAPAMASKIKSIADLKGRTVGVSSPGSTTHQLLNFLLASHGLSPTEVSAVPVGIAGSAIAALEHGKIDAAALVASTLATFEYRHPDARLLADVRTKEGTKQQFGEADFPWATLMARDAWLHSNPDIARRFAHTVQNAMHWMATHSAEEVRATIPESLRMPDAEADLKSIRIFQETMTPSGVAPGHLETVRKFLAVSDERVRNSRFDFSKVLLRDFAEPTPK